MMMTQDGTMPPTPLIAFPIAAPVQAERFDLAPTVIDAITAAELAPQAGDVIAVSSKYAAISEGRVVTLADVTPTDEAREIAARYHMDPALAQLVLDEADMVFGGIGLGYLLTATHGVILPNAGLDRSNIPAGQVVLFSEQPYATAAHLHASLTAHYGVPLGLMLTDSCLMPGRTGTIGVALACAGFAPTSDERGKADLFGNPMAVTVRGVADQLAVVAAAVMGERDEATPLALIRGADVTLSDAPRDVGDVAIDWRYDIYVESLTAGLRGEEVIRMIHEAPPYQQKS
jgi:coenzyme F420-0:L-glutamate ligase/coenzyme F420-1:gamma-L-glutamate ligase